MQLELVLEVAQRLIDVLALFFPPRRVRILLFAPLRVRLSLFLLDQAPFFRTCFVNLTLLLALSALLQFSGFRGVSLFQNNRIRQPLCLVCRFQLRIFRQILLNNPFAIRVFRPFLNDSILSRFCLVDLFQLRICRRILLKNQSHFDAF